jgi:hypothetical protein
LRVTGGFEIRMLGDLWEWATFGCVLMRLMRALEEKSVVDGHVGVEVGVGVGSAGADVERDVDVGPLDTHMKNNVQMRQGEVAGQDTNQTLTDVEPDSLSLL